MFLFSLLRLISINYVIQKLLTNQYFILNQIEKRMIYFCVRPYALLNATIFFIFVCNYSVRIEQRSMRARTRDGNEGCIESDPISHFRITSHEYSIMFNKSIWT